MNKLLAYALLVAAVGLLIIMTQCRRPTPPPPITPTLSISATPSLTHTPTATGTAVNTSTLTPSPSPTLTPTLTPQASSTRHDSTSTITATAVPATPTFTPLPLAFYIVTHPIDDTLWNRAAVDCGDANLWGNLQRNNDIKNPRHLRTGDRVELICR